MRVKSVGCKTEYILKEERDLPSEERTIFIYRQPNLAEKQRQGESGDIEVIGDPEKRGVPGHSVKTIVRTGDLLKKRVQLVRTCLVDVQNLKDENGNVITWCKGVSKDECMSMIFEIVPELYEAIMEDSTLSEEEGKNSVSA